MGVDLSARLIVNWCAQSIKDTSLSGEAAYNLMSIFLLTESTLMAKNISDKWLAV
jgi:hypothetical protein